MHHSSECDCGNPTHHGHGMASQHHGCCCGHGHGMHRFPTREEIVAELEEYLEHLQAEVEGIKERIAEFKKTG